MKTPCFHHLTLKVSNKTLPALKNPVASWDEVTDEWQKRCVREASVTDPSRFMLVVATQPWGCVAVASMNHVVILSSRARPSR